MRHHLRSVEARSRSQQDWHLGERCEHYCTWREDALCLRPVELTPVRVTCQKGSSYSGGHVLQLGATDKRVKAVSSQVPFVSGSGNFRSLVRADFIGGMLQAFEKGEIQPHTFRLFFPLTLDLLVADRHERAKGGKPGTLPVVDENVSTLSYTPPKLPLFLNQCSPLNPFPLQPMNPSSLPTADSWEFFNRVGLQGAAKGKWQNSVTMRR